MPLILGGETTFVVDSLYATAIAFDVGNNGEPAIILIQLYSLPFFDGFHML